MAGNNASAPFSVTTAIILGLLASFVQSLGLTIQRKSHLVNESLPAVKRRTEWKRPLWLLGFAIFLIANVGGTVFQIGALPIVMLAPLGAVSLLYNALLARFLLNDLLSKYMIMGTALIASGAVMIGYFGVVPSPPHDLDELLDLYARPTFVAFATIFTFLFIGVLTVSHLAQWQMHARMHRPAVPPKPFRPKYRGGGPRSRLRRRWSAPTLAPVAEVSESSSGIATPVLAIQDEAARRGSNLSPQQPRTTTTTTDSTAKRDYGSLGRSETLGSKRRKKSSFDVPRLELREAEQRMDAETIKRTKLGLAVAFGGASGTLSGACLLLAKSGVELLILSFSGQNQFGRWQSWFLIGVLLAAALLQLWYLNKALKLADPTLVCPLAFCFYNTASIALGLVYFDQLGALAWYDMLFVALGTGVLLSGVWVVSLHGGDEEGDEGEEGEPLLLSPAFSPETAAPSQDFEGLIAANAAGIAGPHLPPAHSVSPHTSTIAEPSSAVVESPPGSPTTSRLRSNSSSSTSTPSGTIKKRRSGTSGGHQRRPTITLDFPLRDDLLSPTTSSSTLFQPELGDLESASFSSEPAPAATDVQSAVRRNSSLYNTILEHGLSIGISPSSPGFYLQPRSPSLSRQTSSWKGRPLRAPQRSMSEADVDPPSALRASAESSTQTSTVPPEDPAATSSGFAVILDRFDLTRRLDSIGLGRGTGKKKARWWNSWSSNNPDTTQPLLDPADNDEDDEVQPHTQGPRIR